MIHQGLEILSEEESLRLLGTAGIGRIGISLGAMPAILPVNYALLNGDIVFRTGEGLKLRAALHHTVVAFQVDRADPTSHEGWSVLVVGTARELADADLEAARRVPVTPWAPGERGHLVRIRPEFISGRRIPRGGGTSPGGEGRYDLDAPPAPPGRPGPSG